MSRVLVDSNVLLDVATADTRWGDWSRRALTEAGATSELVINPLVYAEVSVGYDDVATLDAALSMADLRRESLPWEAAFLAGKCFRAYRRRGGRRTSLLPDLDIGAHAAVAGYRLLTRDTARYRTYFPTVELIAP
jgi:predicted nucleic acid-binding protein